MVIDEDYILRDDLTDPDETTAVEITADVPWKGITYRYAAVSFLEDKDTGKANMRFTFDIIDPLGFKEEELRSDVGFVQYIGTILNALILEYVSTPEEDFVEDEN
mgnify:CR=1 FL=1|tara:strand:+ start:427 stop:741 length:315 start_codon:yes stop_codon:yes gene_type:complete